LENVILGLMHLAIFLGEYSSSLVFVFISESGSPPSENQYFSTFQIPLKRRKIFIFKGGIPTFRNENENEAWAVMGVFPKKKAKCIRPIYFKIPL